MAFSPQIVTGDETWCHHFEQESKFQSKQWTRVTSPPPKNQRQCTPVLVMHDVLLFQPQGFTACQVPGTENHHQCPKLSNHFIEP
ncbi:hypothetical protein TNCV_2591571 [Trichonephila clavipes]|nr:hypothetical protein TNCV_2591571 [Trichonephila clavipes]